jgi:hypothetical protein
MTKLSRSDEFRQRNIDMFHHALFQWKVLRIPIEQLKLEAILNTEDIDIPYSCWIWARKLHADLNPIFTCYDEITGKRKTYYGRRFAYEFMFNTVLSPLEWVVTGYCENASCVNPFHTLCVPRDNWRNTQFMLIQSWKQRQAVRRRNRTK